MCKAYRSLPAGGCAEGGRIGQGWGVASTNKATTCLPKTDKTRRCHLPDRPSLLLLLLLVVLLTLLLPLPLSHVDHQWVKRNATMNA